MMTYIWKSWWRHKERFILLIVGALLISTGLSFLLGLTETNKGTVVNTLQNKWKASYDIVVQPSDSKSITLNDQLLDPNYLSGTSGGISLEQYEAIKSLPEVDVAAPISMIGYQGFQVKYGENEFTKPGIYRYSITYTEKDGLNNYTNKYHEYISIGHTPPSSQEEYGISGTNPKHELISGSALLLAAIDPLEEAKLVGLDQAIVTDLNSRYFQNSEQDTVETTEQGVEIPVLLSNSVDMERNTTFTFEQLDLPFSTEEEAKESFQTIKERGGSKYLDSVLTKEKDVYSYSAEKEYAYVIQSLSGMNPDTGEAVKDPSILASTSLNGGIVYKSGPIHYESVESPFPKRWEVSYALTPSTEEASVKYPIYRDPLVTDFTKEPPVIPKYIGFYDPSQLAISKDATSDLPMETYYSPKAKLMLDDKGKPVNPPQDLQATPNPFGYLVAPPTMLTTLEAAQSLLGEKPISAIRIKVKGVETLSDESQDILEQVASTIEENTGLSATITLGSSPQPVLTYLPEVQNTNTSGWIEQSWIKIGESIHLFQEMTFGYTGIILCVILVAIIYVVSTNSVSFLARKKEFAILLAIGWKVSKIRQLLWAESLIIGVSVSIFSIFLTFIYKWINPEHVDVPKLFLMIFYIFFIYLLGALVPIWLTRRIHPSQAMQEGEITPTKRWLPTKNLVFFVINTVFSRWRRNSLSILAIGLPTALFMLFLFISIRLNGVLYTTWLGQYVSMEIGVPHYASMGVSLLIAIVTTAEIMWQNIAERKSEIALLKAIGWKNNAVRNMVLIEGGIIGLFGGILGSGLALLIILSMYGTFSKAESWVFLVNIIPILFGIVAAWIPSWMAVKVKPVEGMRGSNTIKL